MLKCLLPGVNTAQQLATKFSGRFQVLLIEKNSHFQHLFAFPRFAVTTKVDTHKAFIPYTPGTFANCPPESGIVVRAGVHKIDKEEIWLDRKVEVNGKGVDKIPYAYLVSRTRVGYFRNEMTDCDVTGYRHRDEINTTIDIAVV
jgi:hypothetical protein